MKGKKLILGVTGGIAAYKASELIRLFKKAGADVQVVMTPDAARFVTPLTLGTLSEREVLLDLYPTTGDAEVDAEPGRTDEVDASDADVTNAHTSRAEPPTPASGQPSEPRGLGAPASWTRHVELGVWADLFVIAPATANTVAKLAHGLCDNMLTAVALSARCPVLVCPAMDHDMYQHAATQANLALLERRGVRVMPAAHGELASGLVGEGRLPEPEDIARRVAELLQETGGGDHGDADPGSGTLTGRVVLVSAGPTREPIDPVRFLSNRSTGTMGYEIARAAAAAGARVHLVSGPTALADPAGVDVVRVETAEEMRRAVVERSSADVVIMAAAVADYRPVETASRKIKKGADLTLSLERTRDILGELGAEENPERLLVGFALETHDGPEHARRKLREKNLALIVLNHAGEPGAGFGPGTNRVTLFFADGRDEEWPVLSKARVADRLVETVARMVTRAPENA